MYTLLIERGNLWGFLGGGFVSARFVVGLVGGVRLAPLRVVALCCVGSRSYLFKCTLITNQMNFDNKSLGPPVILALDGW